MIKPMTQECCLCGGSSARTYQHMLGYVEGTQFDIYECTTCTASFASPLQSDAWVYEAIYQQAERISGYTRYSRFAKAVQKTQYPLKLLAESENVYWGIAEALRSHVSSKESARIAEIGSGLGYLTYSLNKEGYSTVGIDISKEAVDRATKRYGPYYEAGDLFEISKTRHGTYDVVVMTEIIEHVEDPKAFIQAALSLLVSGGVLLLTTPNKNSSPAGTIWQSDVPSVHLWWFSEKSIRMIAEAFGRTCAFVDFMPYTSRYYEYGTSATMEQIQASLPRLLKNGEVNHPISGRKEKIFSPFIHTKISNFLRRIKPKTPSNRSSSMCVVIR